MWWTSQKMGLVHHVQKYKILAYKVWIQNTRLGRPFGLHMYIKYYQPLQQLLIAFSKSCNLAKTITVNH